MTGCFLAVHLTVAANVESSERLALAEAIKLFYPLHRVGDEL